MRDGLPKLKDFPAAIGGTGETLPEQLPVSGAVSS
jgi:hypothetical protein